MKTNRRTGVLLWTLIATTAAVVSVPAEAAETSDVAATQSTYMDWDSFLMKNGLIELQIVPDLGGRVMQYRLGGFPFLWVNESLAGDLPPPTGLDAEGGWINWGGDKLWPAPQGWGEGDQWPGPPGPRIEGFPHQGTLQQPNGHRATVRLLSPRDPQTGIRFKRIIQIFENSTRVKFVSTMTNIDKKPHRWGIWQVTQLDCGARGGDGDWNENVWAYCPINPESRYEKGYNVLYGDPDNPAWQPDSGKGERYSSTAYLRSLYERYLPMMRVHYVRQVGKIGLDSYAGWLAVVFKDSGNVFVERFQGYPDQEYPDGAPVEFWINAPGKITTNEEVEIPNSLEATPPYMEAEILSPFAALDPGQKYTFENNWYACNIGGDYPILSSNDLGVVVWPLDAAHISTHEMGSWAGLSGRFGVFHEGTVEIRFLDKDEKVLKKITAETPASPLRPLVLQYERDVHLARDMLGSVQVALHIIDPAGRDLGELARAGIKRAIE